MIQMGLYNNLKQRLNKFEQLQKEKKIRFHRHHHKVRNLTFAFCLMRNKTKISIKMIMTLDGHFF